MEDFALAVGLSRPTVSKYFQDASSVRGTTRARIEEGLSETGFRPNIFAVNLNRRRTKIIGLIIPDPLDPFYMALSRRIEMSAYDAGYLAIVLNSNGQTELEERAIETITRLNVGGAIIAPLGFKSQRARLRDLGEKIPLVFVDSAIDDIASFVGTDNQRSVALITEYLCRSGERPTYFDMPVVNDNAIERRRAYAATMARLGLEAAFVDSSLVADWNFERVSFERARDVLRGGGFPTRTLLCANDRVAFGVIAAINETGARIGAAKECDYRVAGHDDQPLAAYASPSLTTVSQDVERMGRIALDMLLRKIGRPGDASSPPPQSDRVLLGAELVFRNSA
jgi:DNA-binding LacI/PurR family transcriptional regulator